MSFTIEKFVDHEQWLATRRQHVTATEIAALASGGRDTWDRIRREKETGERSFTGNRFTLRVHVPRGVPAPHPGRVRPRRVGDLLHPGHDRWWGASGCGVEDEAGWVG